MEAPSFAIPLAVLAALAAAGPSPAAEKRPPISREAEKELRKATSLFESGQVDQGVDALEAFRRTHPDEAAAKGVRELLRKHGAGDEIRITLDDRRTFARLGMKESEFLDIAEKCLVESGRVYKPLMPYFKRSAVRIFIHDRPVLDRKATEQPKVGDFVSTSISDEDRSLEGKIECCFPMTLARPQQGRFLRMPSC
jgi:hypothetical protein